LAALTYHVKTICVDIDVFHSFTMETGGQKARDVDIDQLAGSMVMQCPPVA